MIDEPTMSEEGWEPVGEADEVFGPPAELPPPLADPMPDLLNTHEVSPEDFERLVLSMARRIDGAHDVHRYGNPGQAQHGLDVVAFFASGPPTLYQAKRYQAFTADHLETAVRTYADGERPFGAARFVVAVSCEARDTATVERLATLRDGYPDLEVELWDAREISERLRGKPEIVRRHFGAPTAESFCGTPTTESPAGELSIAADAVLRGPIASLGLAEDLRQAELTLEGSPEQAAAQFGTIAEKLEVAGFHPHAPAVRESQAKALRAGEKRREEAEVRLALGWRQVEAGDPFSAQIQVREISEWGEDAPDEVVLAANALAAAAGLRNDYAVTLDDLAQAFDELPAGDPHRLHAGLILAEEAVAARREEVIAARAKRLTDIADQQPLTDEGFLFACRLRMCLADAGVEDWDILAARARESYPPAATALAQARYARHLTLSGKSQAAEQAWRNAIERGVMANLNDDAADWLYSLRTAKVIGGRVSADLNDYHRHALALRSVGSGTLLPEPYRSRERALAAMGDESYPQALEALRRCLWRASIGADLTQELDAHKRLGDLFAATGRLKEALAHYTAGGERKKAEALAGRLADEPLEVSIDLLSDRAWERAAVYAFIVQAADLLSDESGTLWLVAAFDEIEAEPHRASFGSPDPTLQAFEVVGALASLMSNEQATRFLEISEGLIPREANRYRHTDDAQLKALVGIATAHPDLRASVVEQLCKALLNGSHMAESVLRFGAEALRSEPEVVASVLTEAASEGDSYAAFGLMAADADARAVAPLARERLGRALQPRAHEPGTTTFGTDLVQVAALATTLGTDDQVHLARQMVVVCGDEAESSTNRQEALDALRVVARFLPEEVRDELFESILPFATGEMPQAPSPESVIGTDDLLARFRFMFADPSLAPAALRTSAALAHGQVQYDAVRDLALRMIRDADDVTLNRLAGALSAIPPEHLGIDLAMLASHKSHWLRALGAVVWIQMEDADPEIGLRLASDPSSDVRRSLASGLKQQERFRAVREVLSSDPRRSIRAAVA